jgi:hypothetical protein
MTLRSSCKCSVHPRSSERFDYTIYFLKTRKEKYKSTA